MKIIVTKILSLNLDGACCYLLNIGNQLKILLDCGIPHDFNFQQYLKYKSQIQSVNLVLISHSSIEYSGALPLLISEFGIQPKIVYTTQPIMRYAPLNFHEQVLNMRYENYDKKIFNQIYSYFQSIQIIKPYQKKVISVETKNYTDSLLKGNSKTIHFSSYQAGGTLSSLCWKIRTGLVNILYMVDFNNFSLNHINGLDLEAIKNQSINILLTDMYPAIPDQKIKKDKLYIELKKVLIDFYNRQAIDPVRPKIFMGDNQKKLLITCYPNQMLIQMMITLRKIINDLQQAAMRQKIGVIHLSSRYLQLIKSQVQNFSQESKPFVDKIDEYYVHGKTLTCRINVSTINQINGVLNSALTSTQNIQVFHFGEGYNLTKLTAQLTNGKQNLSNYKIFRQENTIEDSFPKIESIKKQEKLQQEEQIQLKEQEDIIDKEQPSNINLKIQRSLSSMLKQQKQNIDTFNSVNLGITSNKQKSLVGKYLSQIGFPHFVKTHQEQEFDFNDYGLKHHLQPSNRPAKRTINDIGFTQNQQLPDISLTAKKSTVEVMNIQFGIQPNPTILDINLIGKVIQNNCMRTNFNSSLKLLQLLNPKHTFILNSGPQLSSQKLFKQYKSNFKGQLYNIATSPKSQCIVEVQNELVEYKVNYLPLGQNAVQKIKGKIQSINGVIHLHIQILQQKQILEFRLQRFFKECKNHFGKNVCKFIGNGIMIAGVSIHREGNHIILSGEYSQAYFKVRTKLYNFLQIR